MRDRPRGVAIAHRFDIRMKASGIGAARARFIYVPFFYLRICTLTTMGVRSHGKMEQR